MGITKAKETLLMGKRLTAEEGVKCGFVNAVVEGGEGFGGRVEDVVRGEFEGLDLEAVRLLWLFNGVQRRLNTEFSHLPVR